MLHRYYDKRLFEANEDLRRILEEDSLVSGSEPIPDKEEVFEKLADGYIRYCCLLNSLNECYRGMVQPDKRHVVRRLMEAVVGRILEIKADFVAFELTDFQYLDSRLVANNVTRDSIEIQIPAYYRETRDDELREWDLVIDAVHGEALGKLSEVDEEVAKGGDEVGEVPPGSGAGGEEIAGEEEGESEEEREEDEDEDEEEEGEGEEGVQRDEEEAKRGKRPAAFKKIVLSASRIEFIRVIGVVQKHERCRVVRLRLQLERERQRIRHDIAWLIHKEIPPDVKLKSAEIIGRFWKRYKNRRHEKYHEARNDILLGAATSSYRDQRWRKELEARRAQRRDRQLEAVAAIADTAAVVAIRLESQMTDQITEDIVEELRYFIREWYDVTLAAEQPQFPDWPDPEPIPPPNKILGLPKGCPEEWTSQVFEEVVNEIPRRWLGTGKELPMLGGSALITAGHWVPPDLYLLAVEATRIAKEKSKGQAKKKLTKEELKQLKEQEREKLEAEQEAERIKLEELKKKGFMPLKSNFLETMRGAQLEYEQDWRLNDDVERNPTQGPLEERIVEEEAFKLQLRVRRAVDEIMLLELERLQAALQRDNKRFNRNAIKPQKPKNNPKKKEKKEPPPVDKRALLEELAAKGIATKYERKTFEEHVVGEYALSNEVQRTDLFLDPEPRLGDLRQVIKEYCVLPLGGSLELREWLPAGGVVRSVLLAGPPERVVPAVQALCTQAGALLLRLDPLSVSRAYRTNKLIKVLTKAMKAFEPTVVWVDGIEKSYYKKVPKAEKKLKAKQLAKALPKLVSAISPDVKSLLLGTAYEPWLAKPSMVELFEKVIGWPRQDTATMAGFWHDRLMSYHGVERHFPCTSLATVTVNYPTDILDEVIKKVMTPERIISLKYRPLEAAEFVAALPDVLELPATAVQPRQPSHWEWAVECTPLYQERKEKLVQEAEMRAKLEKLDAKKNKKEPGVKKVVTLEDELAAVDLEFGDFEVWNPTPSQAALDAEQRSEMARVVEEWEDE